MGPKKRPAATDATVSSAKRKKVVVGGTSNIGEPGTSETHAPGRSKRSSISEHIHNTTATKTTSASKAKPEAKKSTTKAQGTTTARGRGTPRKDATAPTEKQQVPETPGTPPSKPVGGPKKSARAKLTRVASHRPVEATMQAVEEAPRSPQTAVAPTPNPKRRPKSNTTTATTKATKVIGTGKGADKPQDKPKTRKVEEKAAAPKAGTDEEHDGLTASKSGWNAADEDDGKQYWLMKAEPDSRVENGVDVKFSIDDLMNAKVPEGWDGVRNVVARNRMRAMKKGDLAFFYHSNTKVPGVAGIMEIVGEHSIDESAFNSASPYYDPKSSRDKPKWDLVHVKFVRKFSKLIPLSDLRRYGQPGGALQDLEMLKQSRLSVSAVKPREWHFILGLASQNDLDDEPEEGVKVSSEQSTFPVLIFLAVSQMSNLSENDR